MNTRELLDRMAENISVRRSFGASYEREGLLVIPVALVAGGGEAAKGRSSHRPPGTPVPSSQRNRRRAPR